MDQQELEAIVAAARQGQSVLARLPQLLVTVRELLDEIEAAGRDEAAQAAQAARQHRLLLAFRAARNAAATGGPPAVQALLHAGLLDAVRTTLALVSDATIALDWQLPAAVAQALANLCTASGEGAAAAWGALFPLQLTMLAHVNAGATQAATCLALLACCRAVEGAAAALAGPAGSQAMAALLCNHHRQLQQGEHNDNLCLLAAHLAFRHNLLPTLFDSLGGGSGSEGQQPGSTLALGSPAPQPTMAQVALLEALCAEAHEMPQLEPLPAAGHAPHSAPGGAAAQFLVQLAQQLAASSKSGPLNAGQQQALQACLHLQRDLCARDDSGAGLSGGSSLVEQLQAAGFLPSTLAMLKALEPVQNPQRAAAAAAPAAAPSSLGSGGMEAQGSGIPMAQLAPQLAARAAVFPATPPYPGFRSDLLSVVANAAHGRPCVQAEVQQLGGVELILAQCQLDRNSPLAREWALWAVRNLCEGNPAAQEAIRELQLCTTVDNEELQQLGVKLELDKHSGKLRVTKREAEGSAASPP